MAEDNTESKEPTKSADSSNAQVTSATPKMNNCQRITIYSIGSVLLVLGLLITGFWWHIYNALVMKELPLLNASGSQTFELWSNTAVPLYFSIYMFNWTNAESTVAHKEKPKLQELGPYVYRLEMLKKNFVWNSNDTITYLANQRFYFMPEMSKGNPYTDVVTSPNVILLTIVRFLANAPKFVKIIIEQVLKQYKLNAYVKKTASQLLFDGYDDKLLDLLKPFKSHFAPLKMLPDRFAWYLPKNRTIADIFNMYTGQNDLKKLGLLHARNYTTKLPAFDGDCGQVRGSPGDLWPIDNAEHQNVSLFISDFCSNFHLENTGQDIVNNIDGVRFEGQEATFDNGSQHPENRCYCPKNKCKLKSGVRNVTSCVQAPVFISFPHFYAADKNYVNAVEGLNRSKDHHSFHMTFQKDYGVLLSGVARLQINVHLQPDSGFNLFSNVPDVILPTLWFEERINLPPKVLDKLHLSFTTLPMIFTIVGLLLVVVGSVILVTGLILTRLMFQTIPYVNERL